MRFDERTGPVLATPPAYPDLTPPQWYRDAKLGFFVHWGLYSLPAYAETGRAPGDAPRPVPIEDGYAHHHYAEWYANTIRVPGSPAARVHEERYGVGTSYEDLAMLWDPQGFDAGALIAELAAAGARYVVPTAKHHDGFALWDTASTTFSAPRRGPGRDLIAELHAATLAHGLRFGVYFSGALDWHVSSFPPIDSDVALFRYRRNDEAFARYAAAQLDELIDRFSPAVLWNDIDWPDAGKGLEPFGVSALLRRYLDAVPDGVVNDRWGVPAHGVLTREYDSGDDVGDRVWESTRGVGHSFGCNAEEDETDHLTGEELIRLLVEVVADGGNLLLNVGPRADGSLPPLQLKAIRALGTWLAVNGEAIYDTRPGTPTVGLAGVSPTRVTTRDGVVHLMATAPVCGRIAVPDALAQRRARWLTGNGSVPLHVADGRAEIPAVLRDSPVAVAVFG
jgi:alpha-L-fucosidase